MRFGYWKNISKRKNKRRLRPKDTHGVHAQTTTVVSYLLSVRFAGICALDYKTIDILTRYNMYIKVIWYYLFGCFGLVGDAICAVCSVVGGLVVVGSSFKYKDYV